MVQTKKMNESFFAHLLKEFNVAGELIRSRQEEKQGLLNEFDAECKRYFFGKVSERTLASSVRKTNNELQRLDGEIRRAITKARSTSARAAKLSADQVPVKYLATLSGISGAGKKPVKRKVKVKKVVEKKPVVKKAVKRKPVKKKPIKKKQARKKKR